MFYSHEILASPQYGVATVWLVATLGHNATNRKLTRKLIESVNVPRACDTIEKPPGAPIALRLQGSLLYGVSGVYSKHSNYLLDDAEKMWAHMRAFYRSIQQSAMNEVDVNAGKAKRKQLILVDDPNFVLDFGLPPLDLDENGEFLFPGFKISQQTKQSSQLSPLESGSSGSSANAPVINLNIRHSSSSQASLGIAYPFDKENRRPQDDDIFMAFGEEELGAFGDFGLGINPDGTLIEEPELPPHHVSQTGEVGDAAAKVGSGAQLPDEEGLVIPGDEDVQMIFGDEDQPLPDAVVAQSQRHPKQRDSSVHLPSDELSSFESPVQQPQRRNPRRIKRLALDAATHVSRGEFKGWTENYVTRAEEARNAPHHVTAAQAKKNAYNLTFGMGLGGIGVLNNIPGLEHPLAQLFAGDELKSMVLGDDVAQEYDGEPGGGRRRRSASVAFGEEDEGEEGEDGRRVRPRVRPRVDDADEQQELGSGEQGAQIVDDPMMIFGDDFPPEVAREHPGSALSDHRRSSNVPWNRPSSAVPSSAQKNIEAGRHQGSPLVGRGSILPSDVKFSDGAAPVFGSDGFGPLPGGDGADVHSSSSDFGVAAGVDTQEADTSQFMRDALDREGRNFLGFVEAVARERGEDDMEDENRCWVEFDGLFEPQDKTRPVVAQAFLHVLTLATKGQIKVMQDGVDEQVPFGQIRVGVTPSFEEQLEDDAEEVGGHRGVAV